MVTMPKFLIHGRRRRCHHKARPLGQQSVRVHPEAMSEFVGIERRQGPCRHSPHGRTAAPTARFQSLAGLPKASVAVRQTRPDGSLRLKAAMEKVGGQGFSVHVPGRGRFEVLCIGFLMAISKLGCIFFVFLAYGFWVLSSSKPNHFREKVGCKKEQNPIIFS